MSFDRTKTSKAATSILEALCKQKGLDPRIFTPQPGLTINSDINDHVAWAYKNIYSIPYPGQTSFRYRHGIQHTSRTAFYIPAIDKFYTLLGKDLADYSSSADAKLIKEESESKEQYQIKMREIIIKYLQITMIFHDAGREADGVDKWDADSAILLYFYLTNVLKVDNEIAATFAEAIVNKDAPRSNNDTTLHFLHILNIDDLTWKKHTGKKNIFTEMVQICDCFDVKRSRPIFNMHYLDLMQYIKDKPDLLELAIQLRIEIGGLIAREGDDYQLWDDKIKIQFENEKAYQKHFDALKKAEHYTVLPWLLGLHSQSPLMRSTEIKVSSETKLTRSQQIHKALRAGDLLVRAIGAPSGIVNKEIKDTTLKRKQPPGSETNFEKELRKALRRPGVETLTIKSDNINKNGNPHRSVSRVFYGRIPYALLQVFYYLRKTHK